MTKVLIDHSLVERTIDTLEELYLHTSSHEADESFYAAITELRAALEQPQVEQEPVAWIENLGGGISYNPYHDAARKLPDGVRFDLYVHPQNLNCKSNQARLATLCGYVKTNQQHQRKLSNDNDLQRENGQLITSSSSVPAGWKLVPVEPTIRQMAAMGPAIRACYDMDGVSGNVVDVYRAMLAAAPQPPLAEQPQQVEMLGETCIDGGKCHHKCTDRCFRRECCAPFSDYSGPWKYEQTQPQAKQEPVAEIQVKNGHWIDTPVAKTTDLVDGVHKLYARPHPRQPLTDEQKAAVTRELNRARCLGKRVVGNVELTDRIASAIERTHEIGSGS